MLTIDGSRGEGGGQILRTALSLSLLTQIPFRIERIRAGRATPGLSRQHLLAVLAAMRVGGADVEGAELRSQEVLFRPRALTAGEHLLEVGTAGNVMLVLQTVLPALLHAPRSSRLTLVGGTHTIHAPPFEFVERAYLPLLRRMGAVVHLSLDRPGFYPAGGGRVRVVVEPSRLAPLTLLERGAIRQRHVRAVVARLPRHIGEREVDVVTQRLGWPVETGSVAELHGAGPGNYVCIEVVCDGVTEVFTGIGQRGLPAETVAERAADEAVRWLEAGAPVGPHLADQLLLPVALAGGGRFRTMALTEHTRTEIETLRQFLPLDVRTTRVSELVWEVAVEPPRAPAMV